MDPLLNKFLNKTTKSFLGPYSLKIYSFSFKRMLVNKKWVDLQSISVNRCPRSKIFVTDKRKSESYLLLGAMYNCTL